MAPDEGAMACGEWGPGRLPEPDAIVREIEDALGAPSFALSGVEARVPKTSPGPRRSTSLRTGGALEGKRVLVTAGPTHEPIDPVRFLANRSSGKQGFAIAAALAARGATVALVAGPVALPTPPGVTRIDVETACEMADAVQAALPADVAVLVAAVADWRVEATADAKIKKNGAPPAFALIENPDILAGLARDPRRPALLIGFAAETGDLDQNAAAKLARKGCDAIVANDVSGDVMGGDTNSVSIVTADGVEPWPHMAKTAVAERLADWIAAQVETTSG